jgi:hypothetical protein
MTRKAPRIVAALGVFLTLSSPLRASLIPSKPEDAASGSREANLAQIKSVLARDQVRTALAQHGLRTREVEIRLEKLSNEDLRSLASNVDQIQAAGNVPEYIWILLAIFLVVLIVASVR